mmetsp:Transcript_56386/g.114892  ORF Transcript_56386/g.114892 Transcript_56386/m.114892 type:complete len:241 (+) Transcript_56386:747-1469(+)
MPSPTSFLSFARKPSNSRVRPGESTRHRTAVFFCCPEVSWSQAVTRHPFAGPAWHVVERTKLRGMPGSPACGSRPPLGVATGLGGGPTILLLPRPRPRPRPRPVRPTTPCPPPAAASSGAPSLPRPLLVGTTLQAKRSPHRALTEPPRAPVAARPWALPWRPRPEPRPRPALMPQTSAATSSSSRIMTLVVSFSSSASASASSSASASATPRLRSRSARISAIISFVTFDEGWQNCKCSL